jgi:hypothetical protein
MNQIIDAAYLPAGRICQWRRYTTRVTGFALESIITHHPENVLGIFFKTVETIVVLNDQKNNQGSADSDSQP